MLRITILLSLFFSVSALSQNKTYPIYKNCEASINTDLEACFNETLKKDFLMSFKTPNDVETANFKGKITIYFTVTKDGNYVINYTNANMVSIKNEINRVFESLPKATPAKFNGSNIESDFIFPFLIPIEDNYKAAKKALEDEAKLIAEQNQKNENAKKFPEINSGLTIPFTHQEYAVINRDFNTKTNSHTAVKPYFYNDVSTYEENVTEKRSLFKTTDNLFSQKLWNENFLTVIKKDFWFTLNPILDFQIGKDNSDIDYTYNNTRALNIKGALGKLSFSTSFYESQGRFAGYINNYIKTLHPANGYAVMPGRGLSKKFKEDSFDYPVAEAYISYAPNKYFNLQFGNGKNFIGDGYRSLLLSDATAPYTFAKISTTFWKIKYTNLWMWLDDVRAASFNNGSNLRKYVASHHLSMNITPKLNIGFFESTVTKKTANSSLDINFINPLIFYRAVEYSRGSRSGNALIGLNSKYKFNKQVDLYGQFILDELIVAQIFKNNGFWANKFGVQLGVHYYDAFNIKNLMLQAEVNVVRPFTYTHGDTETNYSHFYQPLAHPWGSNFAELIGIARYRKGRWFGNAKVVFGKKGFDFEDSNISYGGDIFNSSSNRLQTFNNNIYQGNSAIIINSDLQAGYVVNPSTNLQFFGNFNFRHFKATETIPHFSQENTMWFTLGLKTDIFNSYLDF